MGEIYSEIIQIKQNGAYRTLILKKLLFHGICLSETENNCKKTASPYAYGGMFSYSPSPREVYFPFGGTYNFFTL